MRKEIKEKPGIFQPGFIPVFTCIPEAFIFRVVKLRSTICKVKFINPLGFVISSGKDSFSKLMQR